MKRTLEELQENFKTLLGENSSSDEAISFLEDITDSYTISDVDWEQKYHENDTMWRNKYRDRFFTDVKQDDDIYPPEAKEPILKTKFDELFEEV